MVAELVVEGPDDFHVVCSLLKHHAIPQAFKIPLPRDTEGGLENLLAEIPVRLRRLDLTRFGAVIDADLDLPSRWTSLRDRYRLAGYELPEQPMPGGWVQDMADNRRLGLWLMPDNALPGTLESFARRMIPSTDQLGTLVDGFLDSLSPEDRLFPENRRPKAMIHSWLALQNEPGKPIGQAVTARYLDAACPTALEFVAWVRRLFVDP